MLKYELSMFNCISAYTTMSLLRGYSHFFYQLINPATNGVKGTAGNPRPFLYNMGGGRFLIITWAPDGRKIFPICKPESRLHQVTQLLYFQLLTQQIFLVRDNLPRSSLDTIISYNGQCFGSESGSRFNKVSGSGKGLGIVCFEGLDVLFSCSLEVLNGDLGISKF